MNYLKKILVAMLASSKLMAWGGTSHNPTDPATWQDLQDQATVFNYSVNQAIAQSAAAQSQADAQAAQIKDNSDRINKATETKMLIEGAIRIYDGKRIALEPPIRKSLRLGRESPSNWDLATKND